MRPHDLRRQIDYLRRRLAEAEISGDTQRATNLRHERDRLSAKLKRQRFIQDVLDQLSREDSDHERLERHS